MLATVFLGCLGAICFYRWARYTSAQHAWHSEMIKLRRAQRERDEFERRMIAEHGYLTGLQKSWSDKLDGREAEIDAAFTARTR